MGRYMRGAYGKPKPVEAYGRTWNTLSDVGVKLLQIVYLRPPVWGYRAYQRGRR